MNILFKNLGLLFLRLLLIFAIYQFCRIFFLIANFGYFKDLTSAEFLLIFIGGMRFDIFAIVYINLLFILLHLFYFKFTQKLWYQKTLKFIFIFSNMPIILANLADTEYFKFIGKRTTFSTLKMFGGGEIGNDAFRLIPQFAVDYWYIVLIWLIIITLSVYFYPKKLFFAKKNNSESTNYCFEKSKFLRLAVPTVIILSIAALVVIAGRGGVQFKPLRIINAAEYTESRYTSLVLNSSFTILKTFGKDDLQVRKYFSSQQCEQIFSPIHTGRIGKMKQCNVVILILESFSAEYSGYLNNGTGFMPFTDSLMQAGLTFEKAYSNGTSSIEALPSIIAGIPPLMNSPFITSSFTANKIETLPSYLKDKGWHTAFFHGAINGSMGFDKFALLAGIEKYYGKNEYPNQADFDGNWGIYDEEFLQFAVNEISTFTCPFFAAIMTLSSHHPYSIPEKHKGKFPEGKLEILQSVAYADFALQQFFKSASKCSWYENTLFVLSADHTGKAMENFYMNNVGSYSIPIIYFHPTDTLLRGIKKTVTQQIDIMPSVLDYLNYNSNSFAFGRSVFSNSGDACAITMANQMHQIIYDNYLLLFDGEKSTNFYNLQFDSLLKYNLIDKRSTLVEGIENKLKARIQTYTETMLNDRLTTETYKNTETTK